VTSTGVPLARRTEGTDETPIFSNAIHHKTQGGVTNEGIYYCFFYLLLTCYLCVIRLLILSVVQAAWA